MVSQTDQNTICCPEFDPGKWEDKVFEWNDKKFIKDKVFTFFYMPVNFGKVMKRFDEKVTGAGASIPDGYDSSDHTSKWNMDMYLAVNKEIPGADNTTLNGNL